MTWLTYPHKSGDDMSLQQMRQKDDVYNPYLLDNKAVNESLMAARFAQADDDFFFEEKVCVDLFYYFASEFSYKNTRYIFNALDVFNKRYGICCEQSFALTSAYRVAGLDAYYTYVDIDHIGKEVGHACVYVPSLDKLVDLTYGGCGIKHKNYNIIYDSEISSYYSYNPKFRLPYYSKKRISKSDKEKFEYGFELSKCKKFSLDHQDDFVKLGYWVGNARNDIKSCKNQGSSMDMASHIVHDYHFGPGNVLVNRLKKAERLDEFDDYLHTFDNVFDEYLRLRA